jgi:glycosyltransferase 2 family protein
MKQLRIAVGLAVSAVFLVLAFRGVHFREVGDALGSANYFWLIPAVAAIVVSIALRAVRWGVLFHPRRGMKFSSLFGSLNVGYLVNDVLPARLGEVVRAYVLSQREPVGMAHALSTVAVERVLDMVITLAFLAAILPFIELPEDFNGPLVAAVSAVAIGGLLVMLLAGAQRDRTHWLVRLVTNRLPHGLAERLHSVMDSFLEGFAVLSRPVVAAQAVAYSVVIWLLAALGLYFALFAFDLELAPAAPILVLALVSLSFAIPASPGHVGVFHLAVVSALRAFDVDESVALSYAFVAHIVAFVPPLLMGAAYLWRTGLSWDRLFAFRRSSSPADPEPALPPAGR